MRSSSEGRIYPKEPDVREFIETVFLENTNGSVYVCSLPNAKDGDSTGERNVLTRDVDRIEEFAEKWDKSGRGLFFCVSTMQPKKARNKSNAVESLFLHVDTDAKDLLVPIEEAFEIIRSLELPPSRIHKSGHGLHSFWLFDRPSENFDLIETLLKKISLICGGDPLVAHRAALLRMPGSHNTKDGGWKEVEVVEANNRKYSLEELEEWVGRQWAVVPKKGAEINPFLEAAASMSYKPPVDVEQRLAAMTYQGEGDSSVHATQLSVTASMLSSGADIDDVVAMVLAATKSVGDSSWDWRKEEQSIRRMCEDWQRKQSVVRKTGTSNVIQLADKRPAKKEGQKQKNNIHIVLGQGILKSISDRGESILAVGEQIWKCSVGGVWKLLTPGESKGWIDRETEAGCRALNLVSTQKIVSETRSWVFRNPEIYRDEIEWDLHGKIPTRTGLLDPRTGTLEKLKPDHFATYQIDADFDASADCPNWKRMVRDVFQNDGKTIEVVQEIFGVSLLDKKPRTLMRALVLVGPSNSGKSNILNVMAGLLSDKPNTTTFDTLENAHGLMEFLRRAPWVLHEAFDQTKWHFSATVKALLSGDLVNVNVKNGPIVPHVFRSPVFWGTNSPPQFKEASRAIENRLKIIHCHQVFSTDSVTGVAAVARDENYSSPSELVLNTERSGVLNWALEGMRRALKRGYFLETEEMKQATQAMRTDSNIVAGFLSDCCEYTPDYMVSKPDFHAAFSLWWKENKGDERGVPSIDSVGRAITALYDKRLGNDSHELKYKNLRYFAGVKLNDTGIDLWTAYFNTSSVKGDSSRISSRADDVNTKIPEEWNSKSVIQAIRKEYEDGV